MKNRKSNNKDHKDRCPICRTHKGRHHKPGCNVERCPYCGGQLSHCLAYGCPAETLLMPPPLDDRLEWTGELTGTEECRRFGWFCRPGGNGFWVECDPMHPEAKYDIFRVWDDAQWSRRERRFVRTNLSEAMAEIRRRGVVTCLGHECDDDAALECVAKQCAGRCESCGPAKGFAFYTSDVVSKIQRGEDFILVAASLPTRSTDGDNALSGACQIVSDVLTHSGIQFTIDKSRPSVYQISGQSITKFNDNAVPMLTLGSKKEMKHED